MISKEIVLKFNVDFPSYIKKPGNEARAFNTLKGFNSADPLFQRSGATVDRLIFHKL